MNRRLCGLAHALLESAYASNNCRLPSCVQQHRALPDPVDTAAAAEIVSSSSGASGLSADMSEPGEALKVAAPLLSYLGPAVCLDASLVTKLCRLGEALLVGRAAEGRAGVVDPAFQVCCGGGVCDCSGESIFYE